jgi:hypothetical protein
MKSEEKGYEVRRFKSLYKMNTGKSFEQPALSINEKLKTQHLFHAKDPFFIFYKFGSQHGT